jgi:hypothetical protein
MDEDDISLQYAALRETQEELSIDPNQVDIIGSIGPPELNRRGDMTVWPFVGFVYPLSGVVNDSSKSDDPIPSLDLMSIQSSLPTTEVDTAFHLPLAALVEPSRRRLDAFRGGQPCWAIAVADLLRSSKMERAITTSDHAVNNNGEKEEGLEVWGLTGWYLSLLMRLLKMYE